ncbi:MAG TPA: type IV pilus twitching motility protein PilT [Gemmatimonadales bacterium]|nr:type IV pilus twitching motility protein PilT [Gemmatimonadales bacterium]
MPRLDKFIQAMHEHGAKSLALQAGKPASLVVGDSTRPVTKEPLTAAQVTMLVKEIAPSQLQPNVTEGASFGFAYVSPSGKVNVELAKGNATIRPPNGAPASAAAVPPVPAMTAPAPAPAAEPKVMSSVRTPPASEARTRIEGLLRRTVETGSSDLHLRTGEPPVFRRNGELSRHEGPELRAEEVEAMLTSIMAAKELDEFRETGDTDWAYELPETARFRANAAVERRGPMGVFRVIPTQIQTVEQLGISAEIQKLCYLPKGLVLVTGPTGSGKSTTLAALVDLINRTRTDHILTIEDPIEFVHTPRKCVVTQRQVGFHTKSFKLALRAALREDPDVVMIGEMRDLETVSIAIETAETGHLVFGTLHTTTAASTVDRIIDQFPADRQSQIRVMLSESLKGVIAQVLCPKIGGGRVAAKEVLLSIPAIANLIREGKTFQIPSIMQTNKKVGMVTLNDALLELVEQKVVEPKDAYTKSADKTAFASALKAKRLDTSFLAE